MGVASRFSASLDSRTGWSEVVAMLLAASDLTELLLAFFVLDSGMSVSNRPEQVKVRFHFGS